ncbi:type II toxin-antitoxin system HicA family toxin [Candidatus Palauibacter sp.]|uniref:type II toxin-antitoxin system HicA family toxin n=1 Tax=Candidatus Palauibacter sp. TaxID=3101350 RepID=UPI003B025D90
MRTIHTTSSAEIIRKLKRDGWVLRNTRGSHHQFTHPSKPGRVTVKHPSKDIPTGTLRSISRQAYWNWEDR